MTFNTLPFHWPTVQALSFTQGSSSHKQKQKTTPAKLARFCKKAEGHVEGEAQDPLHANVLQGLRWHFPSHTAGDGSKERVHGCEQASKVLCQAFRDMPREAPASLAPLFVGQIWVAKTERGKHEPKPVVPWWFNFDPYDPYPFDHSQW